MRLKWRVSRSLRRRRAGVEQIAEPDGFVLPLQADLLWHWGTGKTSVRSNYRHATTKQPVD
jgi:hypothetical protein